MGKKYYTINLCSGSVNEYNSIEEAQIKETYVHPDDLYTNRKTALKQILKFTQEDLEYSEHLMKCTSNNIRNGKRILEKVSQELKMDKKL